MPDSGRPTDNRIAQRAQRRLILAQAVSTPMGVLAFQILPLFALRIGASVAQLGQLAALVWIADLLQFLVSGEVSRRNKRRWMTAAYLGAATASMGFLLVPWLHLAGRPFDAMLLLLGVVVAYNGVLAVAVAAWSPYVRAMVPLSATGLFIGRLSSVGSATLLAAGLAAGLFLGKEPELWRFTAIFLVAAIGAFARAAFVASLPADPTPAASASPRPTWASLFVPLGDPAMLRFAALTFLVQGVLWASRPLYTPYLSTALNYPASAVVVAQTTLSLAMILFGGAIGRVADRLGFHRLVVRGGLIGAAALGALILLPPASLGWASLALGVAVFILIGLTETLLGLAIRREQFARSPERHASEYLGLSNATLGLSGAAGALVGGLLPSWFSFAGDGRAALRWAFVPQALLLFVIAGGLALAVPRSHR